MPPRATNLLLLGTRGNSWPHFRFRDAGYKKNSDLFPRQAEQPKQLGNPRPPTDIRKTAAGSGKIAGECLGHFDSLRILLVTEKRITPPRSTQSEKSTTRRTFGTQSGGQTQPRVVVSVETWQVGRASNTASGAGPQIGFRR